MSAVAGPQRRPRAGAAPPLERAAPAIFPGEREGEMGQDALRHVSCLRFLGGDFLFK